MMSKIFVVFSNLLHTCSNGEDHLNIFLTGLLVLMQLNHTASVRIVIGSRSLELEENGRTFLRDQFFVNLLSRCRSQVAGRSIPIP
jgi:hypothetical protein